MERKSERMDTAYSPRLHELSATASRILLRVVELWLENRECGMVESESFLDSTRRMLESWLKRGWWMVGKWLSRSSEEWMNCDWEMAGYGWSADGAMQRERGTFAALLCLYVAQPQPRESFGHRRTNCGMPFRVVVEWLEKLSKRFFLFPLALEEKKLYHSTRSRGSCDRLTAPTVSKY